MPVSVPTIPAHAVLGPLTPAERAAIMRYAPSLSVEARRLFRRMLIVGQEAGLSDAFIAHAAAQAREHVAGVSA